MKEKYGKIYKKVAWARDTNQTGEKAWGNILICTQIRLFPAESKQTSQMSASGITEWCASQSSLSK